MKDIPIHHIGDIIDAIIRKYKFEEKEKEAIILSKWQEIVGSELSKYSSPDKIKNKILYVYCDNSASLQELNFARLQITNKINEIAGKKIIEKILFLIR